MVEKNIFPIMRRKKIGENVENGPVTYDLHMQCMDVLFSIPYTGHISRRAHSVLRVTTAAFVFIFRYDYEKLTSEKFLPTENN